MSRQHSLIQKALAADSWKEELSRARKYKEATQKRKEEKERQRRTIKPTSRRTDEGKEEAGIRI